MGAANIPPPWRPSRQTQTRGAEGDVVSRGGAHRVIFIAASEKICRKIATYQQFAHYVDRNGLRRFRRQQRLGYLREGEKTMSSEHQPRAQVFRTPSTELPAHRQTPALARHALPSIWPLSRPSSLACREEREEDPSRSFELKKNAARVTTPLSVSALANTRLRTPSRKTSSVSDK